jgi:hypothetical protein
MAVLVAACGSSAATGGAPTGAPGSGSPTDAPHGSSGSAASATPAGAPKTLDACTLITADEAAAALGKPVDAGAPPTPGAHSCLFSDKGVSADGVEISLTGIASFNPDQKSISGLTITKVSGIGDGAYYVSMGAGYQVLNVRKGQTAFSASVLLKGASDSQLQASERTLAMLILGRI